MKKKVTGLLLRYGITAMIAGLMTWLITNTYHLAEAQGKLERYRILCDAFTIPGVVFVMIGILIRLMDSGFIDGLTYAMRSLYRVFIPMGVREDEAFLDYVQRKREARKARNTGFILHVGLVFMIPAIVYFILFYQLYGGR